MTSFFFFCSLDKSIRMEISPKLNSCRQSRRHKPKLLDSPPLSTLVRITFPVCFNHSFRPVFSYDVCSGSPLNFVLLVLWGLGVLFPENPECRKKIDMLVWSSKNCRNVDLLILALRFSFVLFQSLSSFPSLSLSHFLSLYHTCHTPQMLTPFSDGLISHVHTQLHTNTPTEHITFSTSVVHTPSPTQSQVFVFCFLQLIPLNNLGQSYFVVQLSFTFILSKSPPAF